MHSGKKRWAWVFAFTGALFLCTCFVLYRNGVLPSWSQAAVSVPASDEYGVFSGFLDSFARSQHIPDGNTKLYVLNETLSKKDPGAVVPLEVVSLGSEGMARDFYRRNERRYLLDSRFQTRLPLQLVSSENASRANWAASTTSPPAEPSDRSSAATDTPAVMAFTRPGFNRDHTAAILYYWYRCGGTCARSGWVSLHLQNGRWRIEKFGATLIH